MKYMENIKTKKMKSFRFCMINDVFSVSTKEMIFFHLGSEIIMMKMYENFDWKYFFPTH